MDFVFPCCIGVSKASSRMGQSGPPPPGAANTGCPSQGRCYLDEADTTAKPSVDMIKETFNLRFSPERSRGGCITNRPARHPWPPSQQQLGAVLPRNLAVLPTSMMGRPALPLRVCVYS